MKANELRTGNYILHNGEIIKLTGVVGNTIHWGKSNFNALAFMCDCVKPIELTEEILLSCGFTKAYHKLTGEHKHLPNYYNLNGFKINIEYFNGSDEISSFEFDLYPILELKYLHKLQNLYFELETKELEINL